jgi:hypothetical protein
MKGKHSKNKDKRLKEIERLEAETFRSLQVVKMKQAHKLIEETEKARKRSSFLSISSRLNLHRKWMLNLARNWTQASDSPALGDLIGSRVIDDTLQSTMATYESIRCDLQKTLDMKDEDFERLFPKIDIMTEDFDLMMNRLLNMVDQMFHMQIYCERKL